MAEVAHDICEYKGWAIRGTPYVGRAASVIAERGTQRLDVVHYRGSGGEPLAVKLIKKMIDDRPA